MKANPEFKKVPFNLFWCFSTFVTVTIILHEGFELNLWLSILVGLFVYFKDVSVNSEMDVIRDRLKELENSKN